MLLYLPLLKLNKARFGELDDGTYIPARINTPAILRYVAQIKDGVIIEDLPMLIPVNKARQMMEEACIDDRNTNHQMHGLEPEDIISMIRAMNDPRYIVLQENGRYAMVVSFKTNRHKIAYAVVDLFDDDGNAGFYHNNEQTNGLDGGRYNILVTAYDKDGVAKFLDNDRNEIKYDYKEKESLQVTPGRQRPFGVNNDPFYTAIVHLDNDGVNESEDNSGEDLTRTQDRPATLTDREVLERAAEILTEQDESAQEVLSAREGKSTYAIRRALMDSLDEGERNALAIMKKRLDALNSYHAEHEALREMHDQQMEEYKRLREVYNNKLEELGLAEERKKLGTLYREQQYGKTPDREAAKKTLARMREIDAQAGRKEMDQARAELDKTNKAIGVRNEQIHRAGEAVLDAESKSLLKKVLVKARKGIRTRSARETGWIFRGRSCYNADNTGGEPQMRTVKFVFDPADYACEVKTVGVFGCFVFYDSNMTGHTCETGMADNEKVFPPHAYREGMSPIGMRYYEEMHFCAESGKYEAEIALPENRYLYRFAVNAAVEEKTDDAAGKIEVCCKDGVMRMLGGDVEYFTDKGNPSNVPTATGEQWDSILEVGDHCDCPWLSGLPRESCGEVTYVSYTDIDGVCRSLGVYLPAGYDRSLCYPVVYVSHGGGGNEADWFCQGGIHNIMDNLVYAGETEKAILVTMNNSVYKWDFEKIAQNLYNCVIPFTEKLFPICTESERNAFCGLSMGSMTTLYMYMHHNDKFRYFGAFSGGIAGGEHFSLEDPNLPQKTLMIGCGEEDIAWNYRDIGIPTTIAALENKGLPYIPYFVPGGHDWFCWPQMFTEFARRVLWK